MKKTKVLMIGNDSSVKGGITSVITQLMEYDWNNKNIDMKFIPTYVDKNNIQKIFYFIRAYLNIKKEIRKNGTDIIYMHMSYKGSFTRKYLIQKLCKKNGIVNIVHLHGSEFKKWYDRVNVRKKKKIQNFMKNSDAFIVLGEKWEKTIKSIEPNTETVVVSNTVHIPDKNVTWKEPFKLLFLGVLIKRKGVNDLLEAVAMIKDKVNIECVIAGSGKEEDELKKRCSELKIEDSVTFKGWINGKEKIQLLEECQMLVLPSYNEGLPIAILEAISYGMPVISTDVGDISSAVIDKKNGYLIRPGEVNQLADRIERISNNRNLYEEMSSESKKIAEKYFSDTLYFEQLLKILKIENKKDR